MGLFKSIVILVISIFIVSCGGGNNIEGNSTNVEVLPQATKKQGQFIDAPVEGLSYSVGDISGKTDSNGYFEYETTEEDVFFYIGKLNIGVAKAAPAIHITDLEVSLGDSLVNKNQRIAQILLSLDVDKNPNNNIQLPKNLDKVFDGGSDFSLTTYSQEDFDLNLKKKLKELNIDNFIDLDTAREHIEKSSIELIKTCPLPNPKDSNSKEIVGLSCIDKSRFDYFRKRVEPLLDAKMKREYSQVIEIGENFNEEAAKKLVDINPVLKALETLDATIGTIDAVKKKEVHTSMAKASEILAKAVQTFINTVALLKSPTTDKDAIIEYNKYEELKSTILQTLFNAPSCVSLIKTGKGDSKSCGESIHLAFKSAQLYLQVKEVDNKTLKSNIEKLVDITSIIHKTIEVANANNLKDTKRALFGLTDSILNMGKNAILTSYKNANDGKEITSEWSPAYISTKVIGDIFQPLARIGKECVDLSKDPLDRTKCYSRITQEMGIAALKTSVAITGSILIKDKVEDMYAYIVAKKVLEEFLIAGSNNHYKVYKKYNISYGGTDYQHYLQFGALIKAIGDREFKYSGIEGYEPWFSSIWKKNTFSIDNVRDIVSRNYTKIVQEASLDFDSPAIDISVSKINKNGMRHVTVEVDSSRYYSVENTELVCYGDYDSSYPVSSPWRRDFKDTDSLFINEAVHSFDINFTSSGYRVLFCSLYSGNGEYLGSKSVKIGVLNLDIKNNIGYENNDVTLDISIIDKWTDKKRDDLKIIRYMYRDAKKTDIKYCDSSNMNECKINGLPVGEHELFILVETDDGIKETDNLTLLILPATTDSDGDGMPDVYELSYAPDLNMSIDDADEDIDGDGVSNYQEYIDGTNPTSSFDFLLLSTPTKFRAISSESNITLQWESVKNAIAYSICQAEEPIANNVICKDLKGGKLIGVSSNDSLINKDMSSDDNFYDSSVYHQKVLTSNLKHNKIYYFRVKALDKKGHKSLYSNEVNSSLKTGIEYTLDKPHNVIVTSTVNTITLNWSAVENASYYKICMSDIPIKDANECEKNGGKIIGTTNTTKTITENIIDNRTYYFKIKGVKSRYNGEWSDEVNITITDDNTDLLQDGLIAYYKFDDPKNLGKDSSGNGNNGIVYGGVSSIDGVIGLAASFDGVDDYIEVPDSSSFPTNAITLSYWIKRDSMPSYLNNYISKELSFQSYLRDDGNFESGLWRGNAGQWSGYLANSNIENNLNKWLLYTITFSNDSKEAKSFINGVLVNTIAEQDIDTYLRSSSNPMYIGKNGSKSIYFIKSQLDDLRIYNRALTESEVKKLYNMGNIDRNTTQVDFNNLTENKVIEYDGGLIDDKYKAKYFVKINTDSSVKFVRLNMDREKYERDITANDSFYFFTRSDYIKEMTGNWYIDENNLYIYVEGKEYDIPLKNGYLTEKMSFINKRNILKIYNDKLLEKVDFQGKNITVYDAELGLINFLFERNNKVIIKYSTGDKNDIEKWSIDDGSYEVTVRNSSDKLIIGFQYDKYYLLNNLKIGMIDGVIIDIDSINNEDYKTIVHNGLIYKEIISPLTGKTWLDRNLGASRACISFDDSECYGDYYQWGRNSDGHEKINSSVTDTLSDNIFISSSNFILSLYHNHDDWVKEKIDDNGTLRNLNWLKTDGSSICPTGFRVPTVEEFRTEIEGYVNDKRSPDGDGRTLKDLTGFFLKLSATGYRSSYDGLYYDRGEVLHMWTNSIGVDSRDSVGLYFHIDTRSISGLSPYYRHHYRGDAAPVRCIKEN